MKKIIIFFTFSVLVFFSSCQELEVEPVTMFQEEAIFSSEAGVTNYIASLYENMRHDEFSRSSHSQSFIHALTNNDYVGDLTHRTDETRHLTLGNGDYFDAWDYGPIRRVNVFLESLPKYKDQNAQVASNYNHWMGEAYFIRAYYYFTLVKLYGGVPLVKEVLSADDVEALKIPRSTEEETYRFIAEDLEQAYSLMKPTAVAKSRVNKFTAAALKSRVMLYAGTIAKYGNVTNNGLQGINSSKADEFLQLSYEASKRVIEESPYRLHTGNYGAIFGAEAKTNAENIWIKEYKYTFNGHSFLTQANFPSLQSLTGYNVWGLNVPTLQMVERYEYKDGSPGKLKLTDESGQLIKYDNLLDLFTDKDTRLAASVILPGSTYYGIKPAVHRGVVLSNGSFVDENVRGGYDLAVADGYINSRQDKEKTVVGFDAISAAFTNRSPTSFYLRKYTDESIPASNLQQTWNENPVILLRLGEIYLNHAEAVLEMSAVDGAKKAEALALVNRIRARGGIPAWDNSNFTIENLRSERRVELAFEFLSYWDIRRWRTANQMIGFVPKGLAIYWDFNKGGYYFKEVNARNDYNYQWEERLYYNKIPAAQIALNSKLIQNSGY